MSIATELTNLNDYILDAYTAVQGKGGTVPTNKNMANLDSAISSIPARGPYDLERTLETSGQTKRIIVPEVTSYGGAEATEIAPFALAYAHPGGHTGSQYHGIDLDLRNVRTIGASGMLHAFGAYDAQAFTSAFGKLASVNLSSLVEVKQNGMNSTFYHCEIPDSVSLPSLTTVGQQGLYNCFKDIKGANKTVTFPALVSITGASAFEGAFSRGQLDSDGDGLISVSFPALTTCNATYAFRSAFSSSNKLTSITFPVLETIGTQQDVFNSAFHSVGVASTATIFPALKTINSVNCFKSAWSGTSQLAYGPYTTEVRFPELTTISKNAAFQDACSSSNTITTISFPKLASIYTSNQADTFKELAYASTSVTSASFPLLTDTSKNAFYDAFRGSSITSVDLSSLDSANIGAFYGAFYDCTGITSVGGSNADVKLPLMKTMGASTSSGQGSFQTAFRECTALTTADLSKVENVPPYCFSQAFYGCTSLTSADFSGVETVDNYSFSMAFYNDTSLTSIDFSSLESATGAAFSQAFYGCTALTSVTFPAFTTVVGSGSTFSYAFQNCTALTDVYFPALTTPGSQYAWQNMFYGCTGVTVHFPAAMQSTMQNWSMGGTGTIKAFDL